MALSDGLLAVAECLEEDDWQSAAEGPELDNLPQNAVEDVSGPPTPMMPLLTVVDGDNSRIDINLTFVRCLSGCVPPQQDVFANGTSYPTLAQLVAQSMASRRGHSEEHHHSSWLW